MNQVTALMKCTGLKSYEGQFKGESVVACAIDLSCQYTADESMREYASATPSGSMSLCIDNPAAVALFIPGKHYKITIEEVPVTG